MELDVEFFEPSYTTWLEIAQIEAGIWMQRDGTKINVRDMTRSHINNTIAMLKRGHRPFKYDWIAVFEEELANRDYIRKCVNEEW